MLTRGTARVVSLRSKRRRPVTRGEAVQRHPAVKLPTSVWGSAPSSLGVTSQSSFLQSKRNIQRKTSCLFIARGMKSQEHFQRHMAQDRILCPSCWGAMVSAPQPSIVAWAQHPSPFASGLSTPLLLFFLPPPSFAFLEGADEGPPLAKAGAGF